MTPLGAQQLRAVNENEDGLLMEMSVLGPLSVQIGATSCTPTAPKVRNVLAALLVHADQVVPVTSLMKELWGDNPPASGMTTMQTYILNLRKLFAGATGRTMAEISGDFLVTRAGGYALRLGGASLDVHRYHALVAQGRQALSSGEDEQAVRLLSEALRQWSGPALVDISVGRLLESKRRQFEESRLVVLEYLVDVELRLGMYREVLTELAALTVENPLHEGLHAQYMRALHLSGRRAQALEVFHRVRGSLVAELGLEPSLPMQRLHQAILNSDKGFDTHVRIRRPLGDIVRSSAAPRP
ncbi:DNA-binding SARP family transcriptional activator [Allocatelliglobosispora scoriae]|uniref:DNA-binding SARP family transcriptional activator n=1 Tax=Allocatelliglobosispora scoriae TaxID=643052 RepID=A0A841BSC0_9ACTN|nr:AfsR/SARP family transcriptional regulator [Allocatelliglobosispora scoriae]MBB5870089.1 DNA-binding SARP family transcriptional activator [Allocatelliglobosispora scoriae]